MTKRKLTPLEKARKGSSKSPWRNAPACVTKRAQFMFWLHKRRREIEKAKKKGPQ